MQYEATDIAALIDEEAQKLGVSPAFARRVILQGENFGNKTVTDATSPKGARGVAQVIPSTWAGLVKQGKLSETDDPMDPRTSIRAGMQVLKEGLDRSGGNERAAAANYNGGTAAFNAAIAGKPMPSEETASYLERVSPGEKLDFKTTGPKKAGNMLDSLSSTFKETLAANAEVIKRIRTLAGLQSDAFINVASAATGKGEAAAEETLAAGTLEAAKVAQGQAILDSANAGLNSPESRWRAHQQKKVDAETVMDKLKPVIDAEDQVMVWDDPLRWIANQFTQPSLKIAYNAANATRAQAVKRIAEDQALIEAQKKIDPGITQEMVMRQAAAGAAKLKLAGLQEAAQAHANSSHALAQGALQELAQNNLSYSGSKELVSLTLSAYGLEKQDLADARAAEVLERINVKQLAMGLPPYKAVDFEMLPAKQKADLIEAARYPSIGKDPGHTMAVITATGAGRVILDKLPALDKFFTEQLGSKEYKNAEDKLKRTPDGAKMSASELRQAAMTELAMTQTTELAEKKDKNSLLSESNPYKLKILNNIQQPELKDNPFTQVAKDAMAMSPDKSTVTDKDILTAFVAKVEANPAAIKELSQQLSDFYTKGIELQWLRGGAMMAGYARPRGYGISGQSIGMTTERAIQMASPAEIELFALQQLTKRKREAQQLQSIQNTAHGWYLGE